jgi:hypothetical protein
MERSASIKKFSETRSFSALEVNLTFMFLYSYISYDKRMFRAVIEKSVDITSMIFLIPKYQSSQKDA